MTHNEATTTATDTTNTTPLYSSPGAAAAPAARGRADDPKKKDGRCVPDVDIYLVHLRKAGGRTIRCTFSAQCNAPSFLKGFKPTLPNTLARVSHGHSWENDVREAYLAAKQENPPHSVTVMATVLREPMQRLLSAFTTSLGREEARRNDRTLPGCAWVGHTHICGDAVDAMYHGTMTLAEFAQSNDTAPAMNYMVQHLGSESMNLEKQPKATQQAMLRRSLGVLDRMDAVLLVERFNESLALLSCVVEEQGGPALQRATLCSNWNPHPRPRDITPEVEAMLRHRNSLDHAVYQHAALAFAANVNKFQGRPCFERVMRSLASCDTPTWYGHKRDPSLGSYNISEAMHMLHGHTSESLLRVASCPIS
ncbi:hypothetical protein PTSG_06965 [Salpingoeca rosetta]|uniref:Uncharacterized protein n=1 Tax=Salpingoeca rosetta (strain ATCC 50818 / BSB-021) TaxID=946362 RepID=F2UFB5_SALR5|nr:uncharacterized protein PTSG_06965 [Salpingoeca rosetta]EGD75315.1 hypothetical protein PTSG_06965 [Salpingoeca rosetta]|eukprot:XP_004992368.1 hypothetical protein PTSG_06965 [Salpingoeca rosetta]